MLTIYLDGTKVAYVGDHCEVEGGTTRSYYFLGGQRVAMRVDEGASEEVYWFHTDHLGSTSLLSDAAGEPVPGSQVRYLPYGEYRTTATADLTDVGYTGHRDTGLGLIYMRARYYIGSVGRFASADSIVPDPLNPQSLSRYTYVFGNPLLFVDPTGHDCANPTNPGEATHCAYRAAQMLSYAIGLHYRYQRILYREESDGAMTETVKEYEGWSLATIAGDGRVLRSHAHFPFMDDEVVFDGRVDIYSPGRDDPFSLPVTKLMYDRDAGISEWMIPFRLGEPAPMEHLGPGNSEAGRSVGQVIWDEKLAPPVFDVNWTSVRNDHELVQPQILRLNDRALRVNDGDSGGGVFVTGASGPSLVAVNWSVVYADPTHRMRLPISWAARNRFWEVR